MKQLARMPGLRIWPHRTLGTLPQLAAACLGGLLLGFATLVASPWLVLGLVCGGLFAVAAFIRPELFLLALVATTTTIISPDEMPVIFSIGPGRVFITDFILLAPFGLIALRWLSDRDFEIVRTPLDWPLLAFYGIALLATLLGFIREIPPGTGINQIFSSPPEIISLAIPHIRLVTYYLLFFAVTNVVREERQLNLLLDGLAIMAAVAAVAIVAQSLVPSLSIVTKVGRVEALVTEGSAREDVTRVVDIPGEALVLVMLIVSCARVLHGSPVSVMDWLKWGLLGAATLLSFNRNFWVCVAIALPILTYLSGDRGWRRLATWGLVGVLLVVVVVLVTLSMPESKIAGLSSAAFERFASIFNTETYSKGESLRFRLIENSYAFPQIARRPVLGMGLGSRYRPYDSRLDWERFDGRGYIHNAHLWLVLKAGLAGYLCFIGLSILFLARGFKHWRRLTDPGRRITFLGFAAAYVGILFAASFVNPVFMEVYWTPIIGLMMGINEVILRFDAANRQTTAVPVPPHAPTLPVSHSGGTNVAHASKGKLYDGEEAV